MADVIVDPENKNAKELVSQGIRAYVLQDHNAAVHALGKASELLVKEHGNDLHDSLGDVYLYYGKALLCLSRQEAEPLGDAIPKGETGDSEEEEGEDEEAENDANEEKDQDEETEGEKEEGESPGEKSEQNGVGTTNVDENGEKGDANGEADRVVESEPTEEGENEEATDLQVAWEVLELAKKIFEKRGEDGKKSLAETLTTLGEISLESENFDAAITDIKDGLALQQELFPKDSRKVAETCYNLGIAFSTNSQLDEAIDAFNKSLEYLTNRIEILEKQGDGVEEVKEIKELVPEIQEKIADMKNYKEETMKKLAELTKDQASGSKIVDGASSSSSKQATDISHLVKRKRKAEENEEDTNPPKKLSQ